MVGTRPLIGRVFSKVKFYGTGVVLAAIIMVAAFAAPAWAQDATLSVTKTDSRDPVTVGENINYIMEVTNTGIAVAEDVVLTDPLPANTTFRSVFSPLGDCTQLAVGASSGTITCSLGDIPPEPTEFVDIGVGPTAAAGEAGFVSNTATVTASNANTDSDTEYTQVDPSDITIRENDNRDPVKEGRTLGYTLTVTINSSVPQSLTVKDQLPNRMRFKAVYPNDTCEETAKVVTCEIDNLGPGESATIQIYVVPERRGTRTNSAQVYYHSDRFTPIAQAIEVTRVVRRR